MTEWVYEIREINPKWETQNPGRPPDGIEIIEGFLNGMGEMGWELVGFIPPAWAKDDPDGHPIDPYVFHAVFKQPKE
jgi:hypothetical protein